MPVKPPSLYASFHFAAVCLGATTLSYQALSSVQLHQQPHAAFLSRVGTGSFLTNAGCPLKRDEPFDVRYQFTASQTV